MTSRDNFFRIRDSSDSHRKCFAQNTGIQKNKQPGRKPTFSVSFRETIQPIYEQMTGNVLSYSSIYKNYWHFIESDEDLKAIEAWEKKQGDRVFLRDCMFSSIALGISEYSTG